MLKDKRTLVVGLAKTGLAVCRFLHNRGAQVTAADLMTDEQLGSCVQEALNMGVSLKLGPHESQTFLSQDLIVLSPGVPHTIEPLAAARRAGVPVIGELELAIRYLTEPIVAITGTNGKTTTTNLVGQMLTSSGYRTFVGGNIGQPLIDFVDRQERADIIVAEVSSFQLDTMETFRPKVGVLLNISEDHLDRYPDFGGYIESKGRLFENQKGDDFAVLNRADPTLETIDSQVTAKRLYFNAHSNDETGALVQGHELICRLPEKAPQVLSLSNFSLKGKHNMENAAAASLASLAAGASLPGVQKTLDVFQGLHHRIEFVKTVRGTPYYNDSKGTNVGAVVRALESFDSPVVLIMGGRDKGGDYGILRDRVNAGVKALIATGEAKEKILDVLGGLTRSQGATDLEEAVRFASQEAVPGDVVLLSPGCSSFDMFSDYAERGEAFCQAVEGL